MTGISSRLAGDEYGRKRDKVHSMVSEDRVKVLRSAEMLHTLGTDFAKSSLAGLHAPSEGSCRVGLSYPHPDALPVLICAACSLAIRLQPIENGRNRYYWILVIAQYVSIAGMNSRDHIARRKGTA
jgi:hypothetical protein